MSTPFNLDLGFAEASAFTAPQTTQAGSVFNFGGVAGGAGSYSDQSGASSAAAASAGIPNGNPDSRINSFASAGGGLPTAVLVGGVMALALAVGAAVYFSRQAT